MVIHSSILEVSIIIAFLKERIQLNLVTVAFGALKLLVSKKGSVLRIQVSCRSAIRLSNTCFFVLGSKSTTSFQLISFSTDIANSESLFDLCIDLQRVCESIVGAEKVSRFWP